MPISPALSIYAALSELSAYGDIHHAISLRVSAEHAPCRTISLSHLYRPMHRLVPLQQFNT